MQNPNQKNNQNNNFHQKNNSNPNPAFGSNFNHNPIQTNSSQPPIQIQNEIKNPNKPDDKGQATTEQKDNKKSPINATTAIMIVFVIVAIGIIVVQKNKQSLIDKNKNQTASSVVLLNDEQTYTYAKYNISLELPKDFVPQSMDIPAENKGKYEDISLPEGAYSMRYITDINYWRENEKNKLSYIYKGTKKIGRNIFAQYAHNGTVYYLYQIGNTGYRFEASQTTDKLLETFRYLGWDNVKKQ